MIIFENHVNFLLCRNFKKKYFYSLLNLFFKVSEKLFSWCKKKFSHIKIFLVMQSLYFWTFKHTKVVKWYNFKNDQRHSWYKFQKQLTRFGYKEDLEVILLSIWWIKLKTNPNFFWYYNLQFWPKKLKNYPKYYYGCGVFEQFF
jgi:hypothetical protein